MKSKTTFRKGKLKRGIEGMDPWLQIVEKNLSSEVYVARNKIFASSAALCERQTSAYSKLPEEHSVNRKASSQFYFKIGSMFEDILEPAFRKSKTYITRELRVESLHSEIPVSGRIDFVLRDIEKGGKPLIMELKTCGKLPSSPKPHHLAQLHCYMLLTGQSKGLLWYISRTVSDFSGNLKQKVFEITLTDEEKYEVARTMCLGAVYSESPFIPPIPEHMKKYKCGFCPMIPFCWDGENIGLHYEEAETEDHDMLIKQAESLANELIEMQPDLENYFLDLLKKTE